MRSKRKDIRLRVRLQKEVDLPAVDSRVEILVGDLKNPEELYQSGDVALQPSKMEGIGFMVIEPYAVGMPVVTTDYPPMNEFVVQPSMLVKPRWFKRKAFPNSWVKQAHLRLPSTRDLCRKIEWCADNDLAEISRQNRRSAEAMFDRDVIRRVWSEHLQRIS
jgi:glycosyltransferase involved in cell wall biosynthesis